MLSISQFAGLCCWLCRARLKILAANLFLMMVLYTKIRLLIRRTIPTVLLVLLQNLPAVKVWIRLLVRLLQSMRVEELRRLSLTVLVVLCQNFPTLKARSMSLVCLDLLGLCPRRLSPF